VVTGLAMIGTGNSSAMMSLPPWMVANVPAGAVTISFIVQISPTGA